MNNKQSLCVLWLLAGITIFAPLIDGGTTHYPVFIIRTTLIIGAAFIVMTGLMRGKLCFPKDTHLFLVLALAGLAVLSLLWAPYVNGGLQWVFSITSYALFFAFLLLGVSSIDHVRRLMLVLCGIGI